MPGSNSTTHTTTRATPAQDAIVFHVDDMTCGHCAARITRAVEAGIPGAIVRADPGGRTVEVRGTPDREAVRVLIASAGYTPEEHAVA